MHRLIEVSGPFSLILTPWRPLKEMVDEGRYDAVSPRFWEIRFHLGGTAGPVQDWLIRFGCRLPHDEAVALLREARFEPDRLTAQLDFGRRYPDVQRLAPVVALGDATEGGAVTVLLGSPTHRSLSLSWPSRGDSGWSKDCLYLCRQAS